MASQQEAISEAVTRLYLDKFGKGPLDVTTHMHGDMATTLLRDILTPAEQAMVAKGKGDSVAAMRVAWQRATDHMFKESIGAATGREVLTAISGFEVDQAVATEVFLFAPEKE